MDVPGETTDGDASGAHGADTRSIPPLPLASLTPLERAQVRFVRATLQPGRMDRSIRALQRTLGQWWIRTVTRKLRHVHGLERLPPWDPAGSVICVANHRSFFDLYVVCAELVANGLPHRILFPVRSHFFYDNPLGPFVNGAMSFFAMYPPIFRDKKRAALNLASLDELATLLRRGGVFAGMHPEGTRKKDDDAYTLLPAQSGVGRVIRKASGATVVPVFVNGLGNDFVKQVKDGLSGRGEPIHMVFGPPIDFGGLRQANESPRTYKAIAEKCVEEIAKLGEEERRIRLGVSP
jgi:1-acyl-sn-glycerol-3-phosphate acyltransferase